MDSSLVTFAAVAAAVVLVVLVVVVIAATRRRKARTLREDQSAWHTMSSSPSVEAEAETPTVFEEQEPPGEELLSPLSPGDWQSPAEPAPAAQLPEVSLAERIRRFELSVPEVVQSSPQQPPAPQPLWQPPMAPAPEAALAPEPIAAPTIAASPDSAVEAPPEPPTLERPKATARPLPAYASTVPGSLVWPDEPASPPVRPADFAEMVAPVEMWFGDARVGVKAGSKTYEQFRKYADVLLDDLKGPGERTR